MKTLSLALLAVVAGTASAQPGADPAGDPPPYPPAPQPQPQPQPYPQPYAPPPQGYAPPPQTYVPVQLTADDHELLQRGDITDGQHVGGALVSLFFGFGVGQAVQGRYGETGWIFTIGEIASITALFIGIGQAFEDCFGPDDTCNDNRGEALFWGGLIGFAVFRVWEVVDAFGGPPKHNRRVRELRMRLGIPQPMFTKKVMPYVNTNREGGGSAGFVIRF